MTIEDIDHYIEEFETYFEQKNFAIVLNENRKLQVIPLNYRVPVSSGVPYYVASSDCNYFVVYLRVALAKENILTHDNNLSEKEIFFMEQKFLSQDFDYIQDGDMKNSNIPIIVRA